MDTVLESGQKSLEKIATMLKDVSLGAEDYTLVDNFPGVEGVRKATVRHVLLTIQKGYPLKERDLESLTRALGIDSTIEALYEYLQNELKDHIGQQVFDLIKAKEKGDLLQLSKNLGRFQGQGYTFYDIWDVLRQRGRIDIPLKSTKKELHALLVGEGLENRLVTDTDILWAINEVRESLGKDSVAQAIG